MLTKGTTRPTVQGLAPCLDSDSLRHLRTVVRTVHVGPLVLDHLLDLLAASRLPGMFAQGLSPRAGLGWLDAARAWALLHGRMHVEPEDLRELAPHVTSHRLHFTDPALLHGGLTAAAWLLERVPSPD
jgi:MoxR-like ATPase